LNTGSLLGANEEVGSFQSVLTFHAWYYSSGALNMGTAYCRSIQICLSSVKRQRYF